MKMESANEKFETSDLALASYLHCCGTELLFVNHSNPRRVIFVFELLKPELVFAWREGKANTNVVAYSNSYRDLKRMIYEHPTK